VIKSVSWGFKIDRERVSISGRRVIFLSLSLQSGVFLALSVRVGWVWLGAGLGLGWIGFVSIVCTGVRGACN